MKKRNKEPWKFLDTYRGTVFMGEWPTLVEMFRITVSRYPEHRCLSIYEPDNIFLNYRETLDVVEKVGNYLVKLGIGKGDKVAVTGKNSPEWAVAYLAVLFAGGIVVPLDYQLHVPELNALMKFADVKLLFSDEEKFDQLDGNGILSKEDKISLSPRKPGYVFECVEPESLPRAYPEEDDLAAILFTSGTMGDPKGVMLTHKNLVSDCYLAQGNMNIFDTDVFYALLPLHHSYTMLAVFIESLSVGAEIIFAKKLAIKQILHDLKEGKVTMFLAIPMLFNKMLKGLLRGIREKGVLVYGIIRGLMYLSGLIKKIFKVNPGKAMFKGLLAKLSLDTNRICICGGGPLPSSTFSLFNQLGIDFVQGYGLTETSPIINLNPKEAYKENSVGQIIPHIEMKILNPDESGIGEIVVKGSVVMQGYYNNEAATREVFTDDGWFCTGDVGYLDDDNYLYLTGRKKNLIVTEGGKNVFPEEIEDRFQLFDEIEQILVRGFVIDKKMKSEGIEALVYPSQDAFEALGKKRGSAYTPEEIKARIQEIVDEVNRDLLSYKKIARVIITEEAMEMTTTKKIKRFAVEGEA
ncbi:AMP-dependent synthetase/ligase [Sediminispirochaeta smaragdinae]|jgi:long-chain acyl-CoA synthetase|uniref:AMP-dependent synthetase and ligase n=1 Tax=Sediminispirochaeta smaragdinae (strain DSM 11293 / JCM 15392 / SEBR 4228) TaxID=573413 RepID=E1R755_SEDSS|nr:AMP-binding protein [Sediminispirochaeta smaragdinae]ADK81382.1 AMP-dependent synthetase and ligase [Sediminispirochaeta smaragdinae DSM 11293]